MKVYGADICGDCRCFRSIELARGLTVEHVDITENTATLKAFLAIRDASPIFAPVRARGSIGIPLFVDGERMTLDPNEALAWLGQPPMTEAEQAVSEAPACDTCR